MQNIELENIIRQTLAKISAENKAKLANIQLKNFTTKTIPALGDGLYLSDSANNGNEVISTLAQIKAVISAITVADVDALAALDVSGLNNGDIVEVVTPPITFIPMKYYTFIAGRPYPINNKINVVNSMDGVSQFACFNYAGVDDVNYSISSPFESDPISVLVKCTNGQHSLTPVQTFGTVSGTNYITINLPDYAQSQVISANGVFSPAAIYLNGSSNPVGGFINVQPSAIYWGKTAPLNISTFTTDGLLTYIPFSPPDVCGIVGQEINYPLL